MAARRALQDHLGDMPWEHSLTETLGQSMTFAGGATPFIIQGPSSGGEDSGQETKFSIPLNGMASGLERMSILEGVGQAR